MIPKLKLSTPDEAEAVYRFLRAVLPQPPCPLRSPQMIPKLKLSTPDEAEAVRREVQVLRALQDHPRVVRLHEVYEDKHYVCLVTELCRGGDLHDAIASRCERWR